MAIRLKSTSLPSEATRQRATPETAPGSLPLREPLWYKDAVFYELHVRAFHDSNGDGIGDFPGLIEKLDYLQDLGVNVLWLLPFYPSPLRDDGYDIASYTGVHPDYGTLADFRRFLREAHRRGLRVVTELVMNHTSDQHPWFRRARRAPPGSRERDFYVWSDTPDRYEGTRIIFQDFESSNWAWDSVAGAYYWHRFYSHQPDLNFDNPEVRKAMFRVVDFWLGMGVDGMRLDAVPYLFEREGTNCENLPETHEFLKSLRAHVEEKYEDRMFLAEANMWPEDAVTYFGDGDECHMGFHFPLMPRLFMALRMEDRFPIVDVLQGTPLIPDACQWALFLRNHDELTLEMVTDEDRDYMYRVYADDPQARINLGIRRRLAPLLSNHRRKIELMNGLLFSLPGTPVIYYGDELGMGDNIYLGDRNGVRTPMQWSPDRNAGFSRANPQRLYLPAVIDPEYHFESLNVESQQNNAQSLLWWIKRLIALRRRFVAFGRGSLELLHPDNRKVIAFLRECDDQQILVIANLSRFVQFAAIDLHAVAGRIPVELFGRTRFPPVGEGPYFFTLGPHDFYWFLLETPLEVEEKDQAEESLPSLRVRGSWMNTVRRRVRPSVLSALERYLRTTRWFASKARTVSALSVTDMIPMSLNGTELCLALLRVEYREGEPEAYVLPLAFSPDDSEGKAKDRGHRIARLTVEKKKAPPVKGCLYEPLAGKAFAERLLQAVGRRLRFTGERGEVAGLPTRHLKTIWSPKRPVPEPSLMGAEQSNTSFRFGQSLILKLYRKVDPGVNPDLEIGQYLTEKAKFEYTPRVTGSLEYRAGKGPGATLGILQEYVPNEGDAWRFTLDALHRYWERCLSLPPEQRDAEIPGPSSLLERSRAEPDNGTRSLLGPYYSSAAVLGEITAQLHLALAAETEDPAFAPEPDPPHFARSLYQSVRSQANDSLDLLRRKIDSIPDTDRPLATKLLTQGEDLQRYIRRLTDSGISAQRIRCHGDFHLGQVLHTGKDFIIIDFEGEPARSISERRLKRSPLRDVAGMIRSFHYASVVGLKHGGNVRPEDQPLLLPWARIWYYWVSGAFLKGYLDTAGSSGFLPRTRSGIGALLEIFLVEKAIYELKYELNSRPEWVLVPIQGILDILGSSEQGNEGMHD